MIEIIGWNKNAFKTHHECLTSAGHRSSQCLHCVEILPLVQKGMTNKDIARVLELGEGTVRN
jgi:FixJ family two-component response regulator